MTTQTEYELLRQPRDLTYYGGPADGKRVFTEQIMVASLSGVTRNPYDGTVNVWCWWNTLTQGKTDKPISETHGYTVVGDMAFYNGTIR